MAHRSLISNFLATRDDAAMRCRKCNYPLWNLSEPRCPECGERFDILSYWFEPGTVWFKCPYCGHKHTGRDSRGLPFDAGKCEKCGQMLVVEQMQVEPVDAARFDKMEINSDEDLNNVRKPSPQRKRAMLTVAIVLISVVALLLTVLAIRGLLAW